MSKSKLSKKVNSQWLGSIVWSTNLELSRRFGSWVLGHSIGLNDFGLEKGLQHELQIGPLVLDYI